MIGCCWPWSFFTIALSMLRSRPGFFLSAKVNQVKRPVVEQWSTTPCGFASFFVRLGEIEQQVVSHANTCSSGTWYMFQWLQIFEFVSHFCLQSPPWSWGFEGPILSRLHVPAGTLPKLTGCFSICSCVLGGDRCQKVSRLAPFSIFGPMLLWRI